MSALPEIRRVAPRPARLIASKHSGASSTEPTMQRKAMTSDSCSKLTFLRCILRQIE